MRAHGSGAPWPWLVGAGRDVRHAARSLRRNAAATVLAIGTVALGIWLQTAMCAVLNGSVWHPLPFRDAERLVALPGPVSAPTVSDWLSGARSYAGLAGYRTRRYTLTGAGDATSLRATVSSGALFSILGERAAAGRALARADDRSDARPVVLGDSAWRTTFRADPGIVGRTIFLNRVGFTVVGIMPPGFQFPTTADRIDLYTTVAADLQADPRQAAQGYPRDLLVVGRLASGATLAQAQAELTVVAAAAARARGERPPAVPGRVVPLAADVSGPIVAPMKVLTWAVACVAAIACATVAILFLIRVTSRRREFATRLALGATRGALARQVLAESLIVALAGGLVGGLAALATAGPLLLLAGPTVASVTRAQVDVRVLGLSIGASLVAAAACGTIPALQAAATAWIHDEASGGSRTRGPMGSAVRRLLVTTEVALAVVLLVACVTLLQGYVALARTDPGFDPDGVMTFRIDLSDAMYPRSQQSAFFERVRDGIAEVPGVDSATYTGLLPFGDMRFTIRLDAPTNRSAGAHKAGAEVNLVGPGFFRTLRIPLAEGRDFTPADGPDTRRVAVISRSLARRLFTDGSPIGRPVNVRIGPAAAGGDLPVVVGVVGDVRNGTLAAPADPQVYLPFSQVPMIASSTFAARLSAPDAGPVLAAIRRRVDRLDSSVAIVAVKPLGDYLHASLIRPRFTVVLVGVFAGAAVLLATTGLYAVVAYSALMRRREFSIRRAVGATERGIARLVVTFGLRVVGPGVAAGLAGVLAIDRLLASVMYGIRASRPLTMAAAAAGALAVALLATWLPARSAGRDDLRVVLHEDAG